MGLRRTQQRLALISDQAELDRVAKRLQEVAESIARHVGSERGSNTQIFPFLLDCATAMRLAQEDLQAWLDNTMEA